MSVSPAAGLVAMGYRVPGFSLPAATTAFSTAISAEVQFSSFMLILELKFGAGEFDAMKPKLFLCFLFSILVFNLFASSVKLDIQ